MKYLRRKKFQYFTKTILKRNTNYQSGKKNNNNSELALFCFELKLKFVLENLLALKQIRNQERSFYQFVDSILELRNLRTFPRPWKFNGILRQKQLIQINSFFPHGMFNCLFSCFQNETNIFSSHVLRL